MLTKLGTGIIVLSLLPIKPFIRSRVGQRNIDEVPNVTSQAKAYFQLIDAPALIS